MRRSAGLAAVALAVLVCGACGAGGATPVPMDGAVVQKGTQDATAQGATVAAVVQMGDDWFSPTFIKVAPGATVSVTVRETGDVAHTFTIDGQAVDVALSRKGTQKTVSVTGPADGHPVVFYCKYHRSSGMQGAFYVAGNSPTPAY